MNQTQPSANVIPLPLGTDAVLGALDEVLEFASETTSVVVFHGDESAALRAALLRFDPEQLHFVWRIAGGLVAVRDASEQDALIWAETVRLAWGHNALSIGVAGPPYHRQLSAQDHFLAAHAAMDKARSLGGGLSVGASSLLYDVYAA